MNLNTKISILTGVGPKIEKKLAKIGINNIGDLIYHVPRTYKDYSHPEPVKKCRINDTIIVKAKIVHISHERSYKKHMSITKALLRDHDGDEILAVWFNQPYLEKYLKKGTSWLFSGKVGYDFKSKKKSLSNPEYTRKPDIIPVYPETEGINSKFLAKIIKTALNLVKIDDFLPPKIIKEENFISLDKALQSVHFPKNIERLDKAKNRLAFDELFLFSLKMLSKREKYKSHKTYTQKIFKAELESFKKTLPFKLTSAQVRSIYEILTDLVKDSPMTRLLDGDVGSGKTVVALVGALNTYYNGLQTAWMAPTEILAVQHYENIKILLKKFPKIKVGLLTSSKMEFSHPKQEVTKNDILHCDIVIGTHSLIQKDIQFTSLGLVIVDEEHRFGVRQRAKLLTLGKGKIVPHYLAMTATPIPRTLAISIYSDLDISILDELPPERKPVITRLVSPINRTKAYDFIDKHIKNGRQAFLVCPLIEEKKENENFEVTNLLALDRKSVEAEYKKLSKIIFPKLKVAMLHGKMKSVEKNKIMEKFSNKKIDILVSTSVIEVGVDVPNANFMIIEDADRFGLAQLHQFRGRVGRGKYQSFCLLFTNNMSVDSQKRLRSMEKYRSGFKLAEIDLSTRGPGELIGNKQSGFKQLKIANLSDTITLKKARKYAKFVLKYKIEKFPKLAKILSK